MSFKIGDKVIYVDDPYEFRSWRDSKTGWLVSGPVENIPGEVIGIPEESPYDITIRWETPYGERIDTFHSEYFDLA